MNVYRVVGENGSWSDWRTWTVAIYNSREQAEAHLAELTKWVTRAKAFPGAWDDSGKKQLALLIQEGQAQDHTIKDDFAYFDEGWRYSIEEAPLYLHYDQFLEEVSNAR